MRIILITISFLFFLNVYSQENDINHINEVCVYSHFSAQKQVGYSITTLNDSILKNNNEKLTSILKKHTSIYIKEQGRGMTASISMRGSGASHTAVYWNGIPVNSSLNGQTDFNTIYTSHYDKISIRKGGGSVLLGSGAIGGAINLENGISFDNKTTGNVHVRVGNYNTFSSFVNIRHSSHNKFAFQLSRGTLQSDNDYPYYDSEVINENGEIKHNSLQFSAGYKLNEKNQFYVKAATTNSDRNTSRTLYASSNANLVYKTQNSVVGWVYKGLKYQSEAKTAFLKEDYKYTFNKDQPNIFSDNGSDKWIATYNGNYKLSSILQWQSGLDYEDLSGMGTDMQNSDRQKFAIFTALHHKLTKKVYYNVSFRKDWSSVYKIPLVFSFDTKWKWYRRQTTKFNVSTNYRLPTINDLYWQTGGNPDLKPEDNRSAEVSHEYVITDKNPLRSKINVNAFVSHSKNLIQWKPVSNMIWQPFNIQEVISKGFEFNIETSFAFNNHTITGIANYSYTLSEDIETQKQLIYVPKNMGGLVFSYTNNKWIIDFNEQYTGKVFTTTTNTQNLADFWVSDVNIIKNVLDKKISLGLAVNNLFNTKYNVVASRPMPGRNFTLLFTYKL